MRLFCWILFSAAAVVVCSLAVRSWLQPSAEQAARGIVPSALDSPAVRPEYVTKDRAPCRDRNPLRNAYFGALHIHTKLGRMLSRGETKR